MRARAVGLTLATLLTLLPALAEARTCPCVKYRTVEKRIYKPRVSVRYVVSPVYPFYPYLRSSWRLYYGPPRHYYVARIYRPRVRVERTIVAPVIADPIQK
jgi:hypothetical protein